MNMNGTCYFCGKPKSVRQRSTAFCSLRCQTLHTQAAQRRERHASAPAGESQASRQPAVRPIGPRRRSA